MEEILKPEALPETPPAVSTEQTTPHSYYGKRNWKKWVMVYFVIGLIIYAGISYFVFAKKTKNLYSNNYPTPIQTTQSTPPAAETVNWKTYTNPVLYYSISYPSDFTVSSAPNYNPLESGGINISNKAQTISISIYDPSGSLSGNASEKLTPIPNLTFTINGKEYKPEEALYFPSEKKYKFAGVHPYLKNELTWNFAIGGSYSDEKNIDIIKKIVSTFTFFYPTLEVNQNSSNWKTYVPLNKFTFNTTDWDILYEDNFPISYSFKYPSNWRGSGDTLFFGRDVIASISGPVHLSQGQTCFENRKDSLGWSKELSREEINFGDMKGIRTVDEIKLPGSSIVYYNNTYCLSQNDKAIIISFRETDASSPHRKLFDQILSTFKFTNQ